MQTNEILQQLITYPHILTYRAPRTRTLIYVLRYDIALIASRIFAEFKTIQFVAAKFAVM